MYFGFKLDILDITRISQFDIIVDGFPGYKKWIMKDIPRYKLDNCVEQQYGYLLWIYNRIQIDMTGYIKIFCLDIFSWICPQFISCFSKDILLYPSVSLYILLYPKISAGANSQMYISGSRLDTVHEYSSTYLHVYIIHCSFRS